MTKTLEAVDLMAPESCCLYLPEVDPGMCFTGVVIPGDSRGRSLGFPTANIAVPHDGLADGVYAACVEFPPETKKYAASVSIGKNPTFDDVTDQRVEAYVHDLSANLYGKLMKVHLISQIRGMVKFGSTQELINQTHLDILETAKVLGECVRRC